MAVGPSLILAGDMLTERRRSMATSSLHFAKNATSITCSCPARKGVPRYSPARSKCCAHDISTLATRKASIEPSMIRLSASAIDTKSPESQTTVAVAVTLADSL